MFWSKWILKRFWMLCMIQQTKKLLESLKVKQTVKWLTLSWRVKELKSSGWALKYIII